MEFRFRQRGKKSLGFCRTLHATVPYLCLLLAAETGVQRDEFELSRPLSEERVAREVLVERRDLGQAGQEHLEAIV